MDHPLSSGLLVEVDDDVLVVDCDVEDVLDDVLVVVVVTGTHSLDSFVKHPGSLPPPSESEHSSKGPQSSRPWQACRHQRYESRLLHLSVHLP